MWYPSTASTTVFFVFDAPGKQAEKVMGNGRFLVCIASSDVVGPQCDEYYHSFLLCSPWLYTIQTGVPIGTGAITPLRTSSSKLALTLSF